MVKIIDRRKISMGGNDKRAISRITNIAVHYSATAVGHTASFENYWKNTRKWNTGGYHEVVLLNGDVELNYNADTISNGVGGQNTKMYNICYVGDGKPNTAQLKSLTERVNYNRKRLNVSASNVKGHREFSGQSTNCPALDMGAFRKSLSNISSNSNTSTSKPTTKPSTPSKKGDMKTKSVVTYLQSIGEPFSYAHRKKLAKQYGIKGYKGSSVQNLILLDKLRKGGSKPSKPTTSKLKANLKVDGYAGVETIKAEQRYHGTPVDGKISRVSPMIKARQRLLGVKADGIEGSITITAEQKRYGTPVDGKISKPSVMIKERQRRLNRGKL